MRLALAATAAALIVSAAAPPAAARIVGCRLTVKGHTYLDGPCEFGADKDGSFTIGIGTNGNKYLAYVNKNEDGSAEAYWNGEAYATHAHDPLGTVRQHGACWTNAEASICAR